MAKFEYEIGMASVPRAAVKNALMSQGRTEDEALAVIDGMTDGELRYAYGQVRKAKREMVKKAIEIQEKVNGEHERRLENLADTWTN